MPIPLCSAELLALTGADAAAFAHAQFTNDVNSLAIGTWQWNAWLDAQGRARAFFALLRNAPDELVAWLPLGGAATMRDALARYVLRAKVKLETRTWMLHALDDGETTSAPGEHEVGSLDGGFVLHQPGAPRRLAWIAPAAAAGDDEALARWQQADIDAGLPLLAPTLAGEFVPQALDLERVNAIRFDKGCYPGQEIAARLHFRGGNKRKLQRLRIEGSAPSSGDAVLDEDGADVGRILYSARVGAAPSSALAVLVEHAATKSALTTQHKKHVQLDNNAQVH